MNDVEALKQGDVLIGFSKRGLVSVVSNKPGFDGARAVTIAFQDGTQQTMNLYHLDERVRVIKSSWG